MRLVAALAMIVAAEVAIRAMGNSFMSAPAARPRKSLSEFPKSLGGWTASEHELDADLFHGTGAAEMVNWEYRNTNGDAIDASVGTWLTYDVAIPHKPEICYPAAGWEIVDRQVVQVPLDGNHSFHAKLITFEKSAQRIAVMYWVQFGDEIAVDDEDVRHILQRSMHAGKPHPTAVKCTLQIGAPRLDMARDRLVKFAAMVAEPLKEFE